MELDLILPACVLRGGVRYTGTKHGRASGPAAEVALTLARKGSPAAPASAMRSADRYAFCGLQPGSYTLTSSPWPLATAPAVRVEPGQEEIVLDVEVTDP